MYICLWWKSMSSAGLLSRAEVGEHQFSSVQSLSRDRVFATPWIAARQASLSITNSRSLLKLMPIESVMPSSHLILCRPLLRPQSLPASGSFPMSQLFAWGGRSPFKIRIPKIQDGKSNINPKMESVIN